MKKLKSKKKKTKNIKGKKSLYFDASAQEAIINYAKSSSVEEREHIYCDGIRPAFEKLAENLILIHKFANNPADLEILKNDCINFMYEKVEKYDPSHGSKAFSYFNVVAKHWLINNSAKIRKRQSLHVNIDSPESMKLIERAKLLEYQTVTSIEDELISEENMKQLVKNFDKLLNQLSHPNDIACMQSIITIFNMRDQLDFFNKRAIFVYIRDLSGLTSKQLSSSMSNIRKLYRSYKKENI
jgi:hypothetical protein